MERKDEEYIRIDYYKNPNNEIVASAIRMHNKRIILQKTISGDIKMIITNVCKNPQTPIMTHQIIKDKIRVTVQRFSSEVMLAISNCYMVMSGIFESGEMFGDEVEIKSLKQDVVCDLCGHEWNKTLNPNQISAICPNCKQLAYFDYDK